MAKRGVLEHEKNLALADALEISECFSLGVLEAFWHWVAKYRPHGDITGIKATLFARAIRYSGDAQELLKALIECGWVDNKDGRLLVHDWSEHADNAVHQLLKDREETFADGSHPYSRNSSRALRRKKGSDDSGSDPKQDTPDPAGAEETPPPQDSCKDLQDSCKKLQATCNSQIPDTRYQSQIPEPDNLKPSCASASDAPVCGQQASLLPDEPETQKPDGKVREIRKAEALWNKEFEDEFWPLSWLKVGKKDAKKAYCAARRRGESKEKLLEAARSQGPMILAAARDKGGTPLHPATWLNRERYNDEVLPMESTRPASRRQVASDLLEAELLAEEKWRAS